MSDKMIFCLGEGKWKSKGEGYQKNHRIFNQDVSDKEYSDTLSLLRENDVKISLTHWVEKKDMTKEDKENYPDYKELDGCLKVFGYEEAWKTWWDNASQDQKASILNLKWFDAKIFKEITGIDTTKDDSKKRELLKKADELIEQAKSLREKAGEL